MSERTSGGSGLGRRIEDTVDQGARTVEEIHRAIADLPVTVLERLGILERSAAEVRRIQEVSIAAIYDLVRDVNHQVAKLVDGLQQRREPSAPEAGAHGT